VVNKVVLLINRPDNIQLELSGVKPMRNSSLTIIARTYWH